MGKHGQRLTEGPIGKSLIFFALPLLGSSLVQQLYHTVDLIFVGRFVGLEAAAAVGASGLLVTCLIGFFTGLSVGAGVVAATYFGAEDKTKLKKTIHTAMTVSLVGGAFFLLLGYLLAPTFLKWLNTPADIFDLATTYIRIYFFSLISIVSYNIGAGLLRALGNSKAPMIYQLIGGIVNVLANVLFVLILGWGVKGSALATFFSNTLVALMLFYHLSRLENDYRLRIKELRLDPVVLKRLLYIGLPAGFQSIVITLSNLVVQYHINGLGVVSIAAFSAYFKVEQFIYLPIVAFGQAVTTFTGQNVGACLLNRVKQGVKISLILGIGTTLALSNGVLFFSDQAFGLFYSEAEVIGLGRKLAAIAYPFYFFYVILEVLASSVRGAGKALPPMVIVLANLCLLRTALLEIITQAYYTAEILVLVYPITWAATAICLSIYYLKGNWLLNGRYQF
jgi:putative MATE family efflux protein